MGNVQVPLWINLASVVLALVVVYLLAKLNRETESSERKMEREKTSEESIHGKVLSPGKRHIKKAA